MSHSGLSLKIFPKDETPVADQFTVVIPVYTCKIAFVGHGGLKKEAVVGCQQDIVHIVAGQLFYQPGQFVKRIVYGSESVIFGCKLDRKSVV